MRHLTRSQYEELSPEDRHLYDLAEEREVDEHIEEQAMKRSPVRGTEINNATSGERRGAGEEELTGLPVS